MTATLHAEWIKLRSLRFTWGAAVTAAVLMALMCLVVAASVAASVANGYDITMTATQVAANATLLAQLPLLAVAALVVTGEYGTGSIRTTLRGTPLRGRLLLAKALVVAGAAFVAGLLLAGLGILVAGLVLGDTGAFSAAEAGSTLFGVAGYLALVAALTVGVGAAVRGTVVTLLVMLLLLVAAPTLLEFSTADWVLTAREYLPSTAGEAFVTGASDTYPTGIGALVLGVWTACSLLVGYAVLWLRDA
jgi:ABC-2 type transport system permease protein